MEISIYKVYTKVKIQILKIASKSGVLEGKELPKKEVKKKETKEKTKG